MNGERRRALRALIAFAATIPCISLTAADHVVSSWTLVPAYRWTCGCAPTAAAMAMGYRDHYALLQDGVTSAKDIRYGKLIGAYMDQQYLESIAGSDSLPYTWGYAWAGPTRPELILDLARAMSTKGDGGTSVLNIRTGISTVAQSRGYGTGWSTRIVGSTSGPGANDWAWGRGVTEIDANRPFVWSASSSPVEGHSVCVWGYTDDKYYILYNTWDEVRRDWYYAYYLGETAYPVTMVQLDTVEPRNGNTGEDVRLIAPDGGESLRGDVPVTVRWQQYGTAITQVDILLSTDGGKNWSVIGSSIPSASGERTWQWTPANTMSTMRARLKIEGWQSRLALHGVDGSKLNFNITPSVYHAVTFDVSPRYPGASLVVDATTGQEAVNVAQAFHQRLELTGVIMSKMDGDARGGAALSVKAVVGKPVRFVGVGERTDALEPFYPDRVASRILGMGDVLSLIERVEQTMQEEEAKRLEKKMREASFDFEDMLAQMQQIRKMGPFEQLIKMLPGFSQIKNQVGDMPIDDRALKRAEAIILSMTPQERRHPELINYSRKVRIAKGSGTKLEEVSALVNQLFEMRKLMKQMTKFQQRMQKRKWSPFGKRR